MVYRTAENTESTVLKRGNCTYSNKLATKLVISTQFSNPTEDEESKITSKSTTANGRQGTKISPS